MDKRTKASPAERRPVRFPLVARHIKRLYGALQDIHGWSQEHIWHRYSNDPWDDTPIDPGFAMTYELSRAWSNGAAKPNDDEEIRRLAIDGVRLARLDSEWLKNFLDAVEARKPLRERIYAELEADHITDPNILVIPPRATAVRIQRREDAAYAVEKLGIRTNVKTLGLIGGASFMSDGDMKALADFFDEQLIKLCHELKLTVVDGGTQAGVVDLIGRAHAKAKANLQLVGIAPFYAMRIPQNTRGGEELPEPNHTHFVFSAGTKWEDASFVLSSVADAIAGSMPSVALLVNGGGVTYLDALCHVFAGRPVVVLEGSGRTADHLANVLKHASLQHPAVQQVIDAGLFHVVQLNQPERIVATLRQLLA